MAEADNTLDNELEALLTSPVGETFTSAEVISQERKPGTTLALDGSVAPFLALEFVMGEEVDEAGDVHGELRITASHQDPVTVQMYRNALRVLAENF